MKYLFILFLFASCGSSEKRIAYEYKMKETTQVIGGLAKGSLIVCRKDSKRKKAKWACVTEKHKEFEEWEELAENYHQKINQYIPSY